MVGHSLIMNSWYYLAMSEQREVLRIIREEVKEDIMSDLEIRVKRTFIVDSLDNLYYYYYYLLYRNFH